MNAMIGGGVLLTLFAAILGHRIFSEHEYADIHARLSEGAHMMFLFGVAVGLLVGGLR